MRMMLIILMLVFLCACLVVAYCACVAAGRAEGLEDELLEEMEAKNGERNPR